MRPPAKRGVETGVRSLRTAPYIGAIGIAVAFVSARPAVSQPTARPSAPTGTQQEISAVPFPLPGGAGGIGFDDLIFAPSLGRVLVPAGRTGDLDTIDPATRQVVAIHGFSAQGTFVQGHGEGTTSADVGRGRIFAIDRTALKLVVLDAASGTVLGTAALASGPDYVRWVEPTGELWVTQPDEDRIEIFALPASGAAIPTHQAFLSIPGGPESLVIDSARGRAYTHLWKGTTLAIDLKSREVVGRWPNTCNSSRGIALDAARGLLFAGCAEGKAVVLDLSQNGAVRDTLSAGDGVDIIAWSADLRHLYLPGGKSGTMAILGVSQSGKLSLLTTVPTALGAHCVVADDRRQAWVCDPSEGRLLVIADRLPAVDQ
jgi:hypothetical protein